jgi:hypothetical protein
VTRTPARRTATVVKAFEPELYEPELYRSIKDLAAGAQLVDKPLMLCGQMTSLSFKTIFNKLKKNN